MAREVKEKNVASRKVRVEFEINPEDAEKLLAGGKKNTKKLTAVELEKLGGVIKASDYLDQEQIDNVSEFLSWGWVNKIGNKIKSAFKSDKVQAAVAASLTAILTAKLSTSAELGEEEEEAPKEGPME